MANLLVICCFIHVLVFSLYGNHQLAFSFNGVVEKIGRVADFPAMKVNICSPGPAFDIFPEIGEMGLAQNYGTNDPQT